MIKILQKPFGVNPPGTYYHFLNNNNRLTGVSTDFRSGKF
jgi:hypothetical protein